MPSSQSLNLRGKIKHGTEKALLITFNNGRESWVPKSLIFSNFNVNSNNIQDFTIAKWFLEKEHILLDTENPNIIGRSGSVMHLKGRLLRNGIHGFDTLKDIQEFKKNYNNILASSTKQEREKLTEMIQSLKINEEKLIEQLNEKKKEFKESLVHEKQELLEKELSFKEKRRVKK